MTCGARNQRHESPIHFASTKENFPRADDWICSTVSSNDSRKLSISSMANEITFLTIMRRSRVINGDLLFATSFNGIVE